MPVVVGGSIKANAEYAEGPKLLDYSRFQLRATVVT